MKKPKQRVWKWKDRDDFQLAAIAIIVRDCPECKLLNTITGKIFDTLVFDFEDNG